MKRGLVNLYRRVMVRRRFYRWHRFLFELSLYGQGLLNSEDDHLSGEDALLQTIAATWPNPVILDVGAHEGEYARRARALMPRARILAFEPHPATFERLSRALAGRGVEVFQLGCGEQPDEQVLYDYASHAEGTQHATLHRGAITELRHDTASAWPVHMTTVDQVCQARGIARVHLLKVDTEGHEYAVLKGAQAMLVAGAIDAIHFEFNEMNVYSRVFLRDFIALLPGYDLWRLLPDGIVPLGVYSPPSSELFAFQNILAVRDGVRLAGS
jgi:FkbM family methyltransferase